MRHIIFVIFLLNFKKIEGSNHANGYNLLDFLFQNYISDILGIFLGTRSRPVR